MNFDGRLVSDITVMIAVIESGNFTKASKVLGLSASGVSRSIVRLEERIGVRLLDRSTRTVRLTSEGLKLYELSASHLVGLQDAANAAAGAAIDVHGHLKVGLNSIVARHVIAPRLPEFAKRHPNLELTIVQAPDVGDLISDGFDLAIRFGPQPPSTMQSRLLFQSRVLTVASPAYLEAHGRPAHPNELSSHNCIQFINPRNSRPFQWEFVRQGERIGVDTKGSVTVTDVDTMVAACLAGAGVAQVLSLGTETLLKCGDLIELFPDWPDETYPLYAVRPSRRYAPAKVDAFLEFCSEALRRRSSQ